MNNHKKLLFLSERYLHVTVEQIPKQFYTKNDEMKIYCNGKCSIYRIASQTSQKFDSYVIKAYTFFYSFTKARLIPHYCAV